MTDARELVGELVRINRIDGATGKKFLGTVRVMEANARTVVISCDCCGFTQRVSVERFEDEARFEDGRVFESDSVEGDG